MNGIYSISTLCRDEINGQNIDERIIGLYSAAT